jgi:hypothetical protein
VKRTWHGVGEVEAEDGLDRGLEEAHSAICRHGRDQDGFLALAEGLEEVSGDGFGVTRIILGFALGFRGFQDGGGHIRNMDMDYHTLVMDCPMRLTAGAIGIHGALMPIHTPLIHLGTFQRHTWDTGEGVN